MTIIEALKERSLALTVSEYPQRVLIYRASGKPYHVLDGIETLYRGDDEELAVSFLLGEKE